MVTIFSAFVAHDLVCAVPSGVPNWLCRWVSPPDDGIFMEFAKAGLFPHDLSMNIGGIHEEQNVIGPVRFPVLQT